MNGLKGFAMCSKLLVVVAQTLSSSEYWVCAQATKLQGCKCVNYFDTLYTANLNHTKNPFKFHSQNNRTKAFKQEVWATSKLNGTPIK